LDLRRLAFSFLFICFDMRFAGTNKPSSWLGDFRASAANDHAASVIIIRSVV
jgi:hypothetical protein